MQKIDQVYYSKLYNVRNKVDQEFEQFNKIAIQLSREKWVQELYSGSKESRSYSDMDPIQLNRYKENFIVLKSINSLISNIALSIKKSDLIISSDAINGYDSFFDNSFKVNSMALNDWYQITSQYNFNYIISPAYVDINSVKKKGLIYVRSVSILSNETIGTMIVFVEDDKFKDMINGIIAEDTASVCIYNENSKLISTINADYTQMSDMVNKGSFFTSAEGVSNITLDGQKKIMYYTVSDKSGWRYAIVIPPSVIALKINELKQRVSFILLILLISGFPVTYLLSSRNYLPFRRLLTMIKNSRGMVEAHGRLNEYETLQSVIGEVFKKNDLLEEQLEKYRPLLANSYLIKLLSGDVSFNGELKKILEFLRVKFPYPSYMCCCFTVREENPVDIIKFISSFAISGQDISYYFVDISSKHKAVIFNFVDSGLLSEAIISLKHILEEEYRYSLYFGIGNLYGDVEKLSDSYREALAALNYKFIAKNSIIYYKDISESKDYFYYPMDKVICLYNCLRSGNFEEILKIFEELLFKNLEQEKITIEALNGLISELFAVQVKVVEELHLRNIDLGYSELSKFEDIDHFKRHMTDLYKKICDEINEEKDSRRNNIRRDILDWLDENYADSNISLLYVAEKFNISVSFLGKLLKEQTRYSFVDYINRKRIEKSKNMLLKSDLTINSIARLIGYSNDTTFRRLFIRYEGITPGEYRSNLML